MPSTSRIYPKELATRRHFVSTASWSAIAAGFLARNPLAIADDRDAPTESRGPRPNDQAEEAELQAVIAEAQRVGVSPLTSRRSNHFQVIGNAAPGFQTIILRDCEQIAQDFIDHFRRHGFAVSLPPQRLTIVAFVDERPYLKFFPEAASRGAVGVYIRPTNRIVLFDWRNVPKQARAGNTNMMTLAHETTHQLCFNSGLLSRESDIPMCIVEGLGLYGETRRLHGSSEPGQINRSRLDAIAHVLRRHKWIPVKELFTLEQSTITNSDQLDLVYAESWLLIYELMKDSENRNQFRSYLTDVTSRRDASHRIDDAETHFGNLDRLDRALKVSLVRLQQSR